MRKKIWFEWTLTAHINFGIVVQFFLRGTHRVVSQIFLQQHLKYRRKDLRSCYKDTARTRFWPYLSSIFL